MTDRPQDDARPYDDRTRDITLPPLPDRPPPVLPKEWAALQPTDPPAAEPPRKVVADQPTDELGPPGRRPGERTLAFSSIEMRHRPVESVHVGRTPRRWPWVLLTLVPLLVIVGAGITLLLLLRGG